MASKSRRKRKQALQSRKKRDVAAPAPQPTVTPPRQPEAATAPLAPAVRETVAPPPSHPHIGAELRMIGILAAVLFAALAMLSRTLS